MTTTEPQPSAKRRRRAPLRADAVVVAEEAATTASTNGNGRSQSNGSTATEAVDPNLASIDHEVGHPDIVASPVPSVFDKASAVPPAVEEAIHLHGHTTESEQDRDQQYSRFDIRRITGSSPILPLAILFGLNAVDELDRTAFGVLAPDIRDHFGLSNQGILSVITAFSLVVILLGLPIAHQADRRNRLGMARLGAVTWAFFSLMTGLAPTIAVLLIARAGSGIGRAVNDPTHNSLLADFYPPDTRARVYYAHKMANSIGQFIGPALAGIIATIFTWRTPFMVFAVPTLVFVVLSLRLKEPSRGIWDRRLAGASAETENIEEEPLPFRQAWKLLWNIRSLRRVFLALPFLSASLIGIGALTSLFWEEVYGLSAAERGVLESVSEVFQFGGIIAGAVIVQRALTTKPSKVMRLLALAAVGAATAIALMAISPVLIGSMAARVAFATIAVALTPGIFAIGSMVLPARARALGFSAAGIFGLPGILFLPIAGGIGDAYGLRTGMLVLIPVYLLGSFILASSGNFVDQDLERNRQAQLANAERHARDASIARGEITAEEAPATSMLTVRGVDASYGQTQVLFGVDLDVREGEIVALLGTNGAGKSTVLKAISGLLDKDAGSVTFDGEDITGLDPNTTARLGIAQVPGGRGVFPSLTVAENLRAAGWLFRGDRQRVKWATEHSLDMFPRLRERLHTPAGSLSGGEQQMLSLAQAFIAKPKLLMIDELSLGLAPTIVERLLEIVREIHREGTTIILVEQSVNTALRLAERAVFMEKGAVRFEGPTAELFERPDILRAVYLKGAEARDDSADSNGNAPATVVRRDPEDVLAERSVLSIRGLTKSYGGVIAVDDVSFDLHEGQILGLIGPNGAGKTTIFDLISGFQTLDRGRVDVFGTDVTEWPAFARARGGLGRMFQDARLWGTLTVREALATALERHVEVGDPASAMLGLPTTRDSEEKIDDLVEELIDQVGLSAFRDKFINELSTGSRRMVEIAALMGIRPKVLLLDEPSSGIAQKEAEALGPILLEVKEELSASILIIEHSMPLLTSIADHLVALDSGMFVTEGEPDDVLSHPAVVESYLGGSDLG